MLPLSDDVLKSLRNAARRLGKGSPEWLASELLRKIASDDLYIAVLDEEATPDKSVTPAPQNDPTPPPEQMAKFVHETAKAESAVQGHGGPDEKLAPTTAEVGIDPTDVPSMITDEDSRITASATTGDDDGRLSAIAAASSTTHGYGPPRAADVAHGAADTAAAKPVIG